MFPFRSKKSTTTPAPKSATQCIYMPDSNLNRLMNEFLKPFIDTPAPWRSNHDFEFLDKINNAARFASLLEMRKILAMPQSYKFSWDDVDIDKVDTKGVERTIRRMLSPKHFDLKWLLRLFHLPIFSGLEGVEPLFCRQGELIVPYNTRHICNRRWQYFKTGDGDRQLGIKDPVATEARLLTPEESEKVFIVIYSPYEGTLGYGRGIYESIYFLWRFAAFVNELIMVCTEKWVIPFITISLPDGSSKKFDGDVAGEDFQSILDDYMAKLATGKYGNIFGAPFPANIDVIDMGKNKIDDITKLLEFIYRIAADCIVGSSNLLMNDKATYGAHRSQAAIALQFIYSDREFIEFQFNSKFMKRLYDLNSDYFKKMGVDNFYDMPTMEFTYSSRHIEEELQKLAVIDQLGYEVEPDTIEEILDTNLVKDEDGKPIRREDQQDVQ